jgi:predicted 3-demethylubiquinone-9 3-methyltransferase (glyoxalase superfamily)
MIPAVARLAPCLMFVGDQCGNAEAAMELYVSAFADSEIVDVERSDHGIRRARFRVAGQELVAMDSDGPHAFTFTPAISLVVEFDDEGDLDGAWEKLSEGGTALMPLQAYDFSPKFGWLQDRYGVSWQLSLAT